MSTNGNRAGKLYAGLTAHERGMMRLHYFRSDTAEPEALETATPWDQLDEVNRLTRLMNGTHHEATWYGLWLQARLEAVSVRLGLLRILQLWSLESERIRDAFAFGEPAGRPVRKGRGSRRDRTPAWPPSAGPEGSLGRELVRKVEEGVTAAWAELLAVEAVVEETAQAFDGEESIHPGARELLDAVKALAMDLAAAVKGLQGGYVLPEEPDAAVLELLMKLVVAADHR